MDLARLVIIGCFILILVIFCMMFVNVVPCSTIKNNGTTETFGSLEELLNSISNNSSSSSYNSSSSSYNNNLYKKILLTQDTQINNLNYDLLQLTNNITNYNMSLA